jgi:CHAT domain-containing protein
MIRWLGVPLVGLFACVVAVTGCTTGEQLERNLRLDMRLYMTGHYEELASHMEERIWLRRTATADQLFYLCTAYASVKRYGKLFECLDQLDVRIAAGDRKLFFFDLTAFPHTLRAEALIELGDYPKAVGEAQKAYALVEQHDLSKWARVLSLSALSLAQAFDGNRAEALKATTALAAIHTAWPSASLSAPKEMGVARAYMALGQYGPSLQALERIRETAFYPFLNTMVGRTVGDESYRTWKLLPRRFMVSKARFELGRVTEAKEGYRQLVAEPLTRNNGGIYWMILHDLAQIAAREGDRAEAMRRLREAVDVIESQRSTINTMASKVGYVGDKQAVYGQLVGLLVTDGQAGPAFAYAERAKSRALVDLLANKRDFSGGATPAGEVRSSLGHLEDLELAADTEDAGVTVAEARRRGAVVATMQARLRQDVPKLASLVTATPIAAEDLQRELAVDETLVEYYQADEALYAFVVTREAVRALILDGKNLAPEVQRFRKAVGDPRGRDHEGHARQLYGRLLGPVEALVTTPMLTIVPHGALHYVPFAALTGDKGAVIDRWTIRLLPSATVIPYLRHATPEASRSILAVGSPDLGDPSYRLPGAAREAAAVAATFAQAEVLVGAQATESAVRAAAGRFSHLHLATHGRFQPQAPLTSGLLLAPDATHDGVLTTEELYSMTLEAELVTLSACETALGTLGAGDEVVGLTRALLYAGSRSVVASLWRIDDDTTLGLMADFYARLVTTAPAEALRAAQRAMREQHRHPFFWAAFQLTGAGR